MEKPENALQSVQTFGRKKTAVAVAHCKPGCGLIKVNGVPLELVTPQTLRFKVMEPILLIKDKKNYGQLFNKLDIRVRVQGGGRVARCYAIRQAVAKSIVAYYQKYVDEESKTEIKKHSQILIERYWWQILVEQKQRNSEVLVPVHVIRNLIDRNNTTKSFFISCLFCRK
eukprot:UN23650